MPLKHTKESKLKISEAAIKTQKQSNAGFRQRVKCHYCNQVMSPANLGRHIDACQDSRGMCLNGVELTVKEIKNLRRVLRSYGWTVDAYIKANEDQAGKCFICGEIPLQTRLFADHCHMSGKPRGLLCIKCNMGLGAFNDDIGLMAKAISYIEKLKIDNLKKSCKNRGEIYSSFDGFIFNSLAGQFHR